VPGHGFHPLKARQSRSIPNLQDVHRQGRTPAQTFLCQKFDSLTLLVNRHFDITAET
jgi:hypothetical protein